MEIVYIIVPVYNVEKYLPKCVESLLKQTFKEIRIILVDDGSPDQCPKICDQYAEQDNRIVVIHQKNQGLSGARIAGLQYIEYRHSIDEKVYVTFLDSDDWLALDTIQMAVELLREYSADVVQYQIAQIFDESAEVCQPKKSVRLYEGREKILQYYLKSTTVGSGGDYSVCQCLFPLHAIYGERFRIGKINEDIDFKYKVLSKCAALVVSNQYKYFYRQGDVTLSMGGLKLKDFDLYEAGDILAQLTAKEKYGDIAFLGKVKQARTPLSLLCKIAYFGIEDSSISKLELVDKLIKEHRRNIKILLFSPIPISRKLLSILFAVNYDFAATCIRIAKKL